MYTIQYFKEKFGAIPDDRWAMGRLKKGTDNYCALGHCGVIESAIMEYIMTEESKALVNIFYKIFDIKKRRGCQYVSCINDGIGYLSNSLAAISLGITPKKRILKALGMAEELEQQQANLEYVASERELELI